MIRFLLIAVLLITLSLGCARRVEELGVLSSLAKDTSKQDKTVLEETLRYETVLKAVHEGRIKKGMTKDEVLEEFGEPVIVLPRPRGEALVYKHGEATWFNWRKVYLFFDTSHRYVNSLAPANGSSGDKA